MYYFLFQFALAYAVHNIFVRANLAKDVDITGKPLKYASQIA